MRLTSVLGDTVEDEICCSDGTCSGKAQFPCKGDIPGCSGGGDPDAQRRAVNKSSNSKSSNNKSSNNKKSQQKKSG